MPEITAQLVLDRGLNDLIRRTDRVLARYENKTHAILARREALLGNLKEEVCRSSVTKTESAVLDMTSTQTITSVTGPTARNLENSMVIVNSTLNSVAQPPKPSVMPQQNAASTDSLPSPKKPSISAVLCANCYLPLGAHSFHGSFCPAPWPEKTRTVFSALLCEHIEPGIWGGEECQNPLVVIDLESDQGRCEKHRRQE